MICISVFIKTIVIVIFAIIKQLYDSVRDHIKKKNIVDHFENEVEISRSKVENVF